MSDRQRVQDHVPPAFGGSIGRLNRSCLNLTNTTLGVGYICPDEALTKSTLYEAWQTPFGAGSHDALTRATLERLATLTG